MSPTANREHMTMRNDPTATMSRQRARTLCLLAALLMAACDAHKDDSSGSAEHGSHASGSDSTAATSEDPTSTGVTTVTDGAVEPPAAPTDLVASLLEGGVHTTWKDASDNEDNFVLEKKAAGAADFTLVAELPFDSVTYHDIDVQAATTYTYRVKAVNAGGEAVSNEATVAVP